MRALKQLKTQIISFESISTVEMSVNEKTVVHFMNRTLVIILSNCLIAHFQSKRYQPNTTASSHNNQYRMIH